MQDSENPENSENADNSENSEPSRHRPDDDSLRPDPGLEIVRGREFLSENVSISGRHFVRCSFNFCNLIYSGGPVGLVECGGGNNRLVEVGPLQEALNENPGEEIKEKMIRYWKEVRIGLNLEPAGED